MLTWAICWAARTGASEGIAFIILFAMILDAAMVLGIVAIIMDGLKKYK